MDCNFLRHFIQRRLADLFIEFVTRGCFKGKSNALDAGITAVEDDI